MSTVSIPETVLTFVGAPLGIVLVITLFVYGPSELRAPSRYRPGRAWNHEPAWYVPHPAALGRSDATTHEAIEPPRDAPRASGAAGGASGEW